MCELAAGMYEECAGVPPRRSASVYPLRPFSLPDVRETITSIIARKTVLAALGAY